MIKRPDTKGQRMKRHNRVRGKISGTPERPRLCVFRSENHIYAQIIDDVAGNTLVSASTTQKDIKAELEQTDNVAAASYLGTVIAKRALEAGITEVVFDRGGFIYQGKIKALAEAAREAGLQF
jgi:large subunit ribosomal protein L18